MSEHNHDHAILEEIDRLILQQFEFINGTLDPDDPDALLLYSCNCKRIRELVDQLGSASKAPPFAIVRKGDGTIR